MAVSHSFIGYSAYKNYKSYSFNSYQNRVQFGHKVVHTNAAADDNKNKKASLEKPWPVFPFGINVFLKPKQDKALNVTIEQVKNLTPDDITPVIPNSSSTSYKFPNSKLLEDFTPLLSDSVKKTGISTKNQIGGCFLKGSFDTPLGTSGVGNCAVICLENSKTNTHALYHAYPIKKDAVKKMQKDIETIMPEGFNKIFIIPGHDKETATTSVDLLNAAKNINKKAEVEFRHTENKGNTQIILYKNNVYSLPFVNKTPVFKVCENPENYYIGMTK